MSTSPLRAGAQQVPNPRGPADPGSTTLSTVEQLRALQRRARVGGRQGLLVALSLGNADDVADAMGADVLRTVTSVVAQRALELPDEVHLLAVSPLGGVVAVVLCEPARRDGVGRRLQQACAGFVHGLEGRVWPVVSIGVRDLAGVDPATALADVRRTVFDASRRTPGGVRWHDPGAPEHPAHGSLALTSDLADALCDPQVEPDTQLSLAYQPVRSLRSGRVTALEALLRWEHPARGPVPPMQAVRVAEASGLVHPLGAWVLDRALRQTAQWWASGHLVTVHVNASPVELRAASYAEDVAAALRRHALPSHALLLELTETDLMAGDPDVLRTLQELRGLGVRLGIDDFGTGWSSISQLLHLPVDTVKVDRSLTAGIDQSPADFELLRAVLGLLSTAPVEVVVEGVENAAQAAHLRALGCRRAQGYHLGRPGPAATALAGWRG